MPPRFSRRRTRPKATRYIPGPPVIAMDTASVAPVSPPSLGSDAFDPFSFFSNSVGIPAFIAALLYPQAKEISKRFPRVWKILSAAVAVQLTYRYTQAKLKSMLQYLVKLCASCIKINHGDELMGCFQRWLDKQRPSMTHRELITAQSLQSKNSWRPLEIGEDLTSTPEGIDASNIALRRNYNVRMFRYNGRFFWISHSVKIDNSSPDLGTVTRRALMIWTLGRSAAPIAAILDEAVQNHSNDGEKAATTLFTPGSNHSTYDWDGTPTGIWRKHAVKPCRPLDTVYLAGTQRDLIQHDVARFLHPDTATRYRSRGIPHRRGYLFYGPPGNGKSSLAMALAGHFGLNVYSLSLRDSQMNDTWLAQLFNALPSSKVLVLLEDIDSAGLRREEEFEDDDSSIYDPSPNVVYPLDSWGQPVLAPRKARRPPRVTNVTLSGVLNALDGIAAPEGHIVVMTSNAPESLDKALIRPGRIDMKIEFKNASPKQLYDIFNRMYREEKALVMADSSDEKVLLGNGMSNKLPRVVSDTNSTATSIVPTVNGLGDVSVSQDELSSQITHAELNSPSDNSPPKLAALTSDTDSGSELPINKKISGGADSAHASTATSVVDGADDEKATHVTPADDAPHYEPLPGDVLEALSVEFSKCIPPEEHSLASVQNYLLGKVDQPHSAVREARAWAEEETAEKEEYAKRKAERKLKREMEEEKRREAALAHMKSKMEGPLGLGTVHTDKFGDDFGDASALV